MNQKEINKKAWFCTLLIVAEVIGVILIFDFMVYVGRWVEAAINHYPFSYTSPQDVFDVLIYWFMGLSTIVAGVIIIIAAIAGNIKLTNKIFKWWRRKYA